MQIGENPRGGRKAAGIGKAGRKAYAGYIFVGTLNSDAERTGYASIIIIMLFLGGVIITILGMIGEYMARIYMEVKNRPIYFVRESNISDNEQNETSNIP